MTNSVAASIGADVASFDQKRVANPEAQKLESYPHLDWLRFILASLVALGHQGLPDIGPVDGALAVDVFLALSGWLIGGILLRSKPSDMPRFFFNRATRIWIPYAFAVAAVYLLAAVRDGVSRDWFEFLFYDVTFTHYNFVHFAGNMLRLPLGGTGNHFWSLSVEEQFYLFAPLIMLTFAKGRAWWTWGTVFVVMAALDLRFAPIALGVTAAVLHRQYGAWHAQGWGRAAVIACCCLFFAAMFWSNGTFVRALFSTALVLCLATKGRRRRSWLLLGAVSYPLYLNHWIGSFIANKVAEKAHMPTVPHIVLAYTTAVLVGFVAWALVDRQVLAHRAEWYTPIVGERLAITAYALFALGVTGGLAATL
ncbi:acyltransferase [uncultured Sphingomonas sp.]|uniref:acyltransferase family protein n=1 Tax=uncultured Sphingomonas sp. TaxID=158754 RepID=UPI0025CC14B3|nr:acyltransferase [uncultured Sphingomonas sp.]